MSREHKLRNPNRRRSERFRKDYLSTDAILKHGITHNLDGKRRRKLRIRRRP